MIDVVLATLIVIVHFGFIIFVVFGGFGVMRWPRLVWAHLPAVAWGAYVEMAGQLCPLTVWENHFRRQAFDQGYDVSFIEHYLLALIYPEVLLGRALPASVFMALGVGVLVINAGVYGWIWRRNRSARV